MNAMNSLGFPCAIAIAIGAALAGCGRDDAPEGKEVIDVTPNAANIVEQTGDKVDAAVQQNKQTLDAAIDAQSGGKPAE